MINSDSIYLIGKQHQTCQDYALHGTNRKRYSPTHPEVPDFTPYIAVADGCSGAPNTDLGSRLIVHGAINSATPYFWHNSVESSVDTAYQVFRGTAMARAEEALRPLNMNPYTLTSTLVFAFPWKEKLYAFMYGDGNIITVLKDGRVFIEHIEFPENMPYYPLYETDMSYKQAYRKQIGKKKAIRTISVLDDYSYRMSSCSEKEYDDYLISPWDINEVEYLILSSDGLDSFYNPLYPGDNHKADVIRQLVNFKSSSGEFLKRRVTRMVKDLEKQGWMHADDLGIAAFHICG